jgi:hypothetical protein
MSWQNLIESGRIADVILVLLVIEAAVIGIMMRRAAPFKQMLAGLAAGGCLVLALRAALTNAGANPIALFLALSFLAHAIELGIAWKNR